MTTGAPTPNAEIPGAQTPPEVEVRRSRRRRRTVSAYREGERIIVLIPATMSRRDEQTWVADMIARIHRQEKRRHRSDDDLGPVDVPERSAQVIRQRV